MSAWVGYMMAWVDLGLGAWVGELGWWKGWVGAGQASWVYGGMCWWHGSAKWAGES